MPRLPDPICCLCLVSMSFALAVPGCGSQVPPAGETAAAASNDGSMAGRGPAGRGPAGRGPAGRGPAVRTVAVMQQEVRRTTAQPATVHPLYQAELRARVGGYVKQLQADIGDVVESGDRLATIAVPELEKRKEIIAARVDRNQAREAQSQSGVELASANVLSAEARLQQSRSELAHANASLMAAEAEFKRTSDLVTRQSLQQRVLDEVTMRRDAELASLDAANSAVESTKADVVVANAKRSAAEADLRAAQAETEIAKRELEEADVLLAYAEIRAPFAGVVTERYVDPGDLVIPDDKNPSTMPMFVVSQLDKVRLRIPVPEAEAALVNPGDPIQFTFPAFADEQLDATVTRVSGSLDTDTRTMLVESEVDNVDRKLIPGMFAMASITLATKSNVTVLPARSIRFDEAGKAHVYVLQPNETVSMVEIATGIDEGSWIEVLSPLKPGQLVVDAHRARFKDGQAVRVLPPE